MHADDLRALFDQQAAGYDARWAPMAPIRDGLALLVEAAFSDLPADARLLAVGVGTGAELAPLARRFPGWRFTAVDPSGAMLDVCRQRAEREGFAERCAFHEGTLDTLPAADAHHAATCVWSPSSSPTARPGPPSSAPSPRGSARAACWRAPTSPRTRTTSTRSSPCGWP